MHQSLIHKKRPFSLFVLSSLQKMEYETFLKENSLNSKETENLEKDQNNAVTTITILEESGASNVSFSDHLKSEITGKTSTTLWTQLYGKCFKIA